MLEGTINFTGTTLDECETAIQEALKRIMDSFTSGQDNNAESSFNFSVTGEPSLCYVCSTCSEVIFAEHNDDPKGDTDPKLAEHLLVAHSMTSVGEPHDWFELRDPRNDN